MKSYEREKNEIYREKVRTMKYIIRFYYITHKGEKYKHKNRKIIIIIHTKKRAYFTLPQQEQKQ
jgi:hypothetical protein